MEDLQHYMHTYRKQLEKGALQKAYHYLFYICVTNQSTVPYFLRL